MNENERILLEFIRRHGEDVADIGERPFKNEHSARLVTPPKNFVRVRRTKGSGKGKVQGVIIPSSISVIWYILKRAGKEFPMAQALRFPFPSWSSKRAKKWLKDNKIKHILFEKATEEKRGLEEFGILEELGIATRSVSVIPNTINEEARSIDVVLTTESKVQVLDFERWEVIDEILLSSGMEHPEQIPFLDNHNRRSTKDQLGSIRNIETKGKKTTGTVFFGTKQESEDAFTMAKEGHLTDVSIGYKRIETRFIEKGESFVHLNKSYKGPLRLGIKTRIMEGSGTPIGADTMAKFRSAFVGHDNNKIEELETRVKFLESELGSARQAIKILSIKI